VYPKNWCHLREVILHSTYGSGAGGRRYLMLEEVVPDDLRSSTVASEGKEERLDLVRCCTCTMYMYLHEEVTSDKRTRLVPGKVVLCVCE
jgi:hypothetical protein